MTINYIYTAFHLASNILKNNTKYELMDIPSLCKITVSNISRAKYI